MLMSQAAGQETTSVIRDNGFLLFGINPSLAEMLRQIYHPGSCTLKAVDAILVNL